jgi:hypothetical protein
MTGAWLSILLFSFLKVTAAMKIIAITAMNAPTMTKEDGNSDFSFVVEVPMVKFPVVKFHVTISSLIGKVTV